MHAAPPQPRALPTGARPLHVPAPRVPAARALGVLALGLCVACGSTGSQREAGPKPLGAPVAVELENAATEPEAYDPAVVRAPEDESIGALLSRVDRNVRAWVRLTMEARSAAERKKTTMLQKELMRITQPRRDELARELELGPPRNRQRAAAALGFTTGDESLSALLGALYDSSDDVVHNALLGLAVFQDPDTPLESIVPLMESHPDGQTRATAAWAIRSVLEAQLAVGRETALEAVLAARLGLADDEPFVRVQAALILGLAADVESIGALGDLLDDGKPFVVSAAAHALALIGGRAEGARRDAALELAEALDGARHRERQAILSSLQKLSSTDQGGDSEAWTRWARDLP